MNENTTSAPPLIAVIVAGNNEPSNSNTMAESLLQGAEAAGAQTEKLRLKDLRIEHFSLHFYEQDSGADDDYARVQQAIDRASAVVIATPIWNFSVPAHLKNMMDRLGAFALDSQTHSKGQLKGKPFYLIFTGGAPMIAWKALMYLTTLHLGEAIKYYGGTVLGRHFEPKSLPGRGVFGLVVDQRPASLAKMREQGARLAAIARQYRDTGTLPLRTRVGYQFFSFLYRIGNRIMYPISTLQ